MLQKSHSYYYSPPSVQDDSFIYSVFLILLIVALIALIVRFRKFGSSKKKEDKTVKEEVEKIFNELKENAIQFKRSEVVPALQSAKEKVIGVLDKKGVSNKV